MFLSKKIGMSLLCLVSLLFSGCTEKVIPLTIWVDSGNVPVIQKRLDEFAQINSKNKKFNFKIIEQSSASCRNVLLDGNVELPDVFVFIDNQLNELYDKGFLKEITYEKDRVITECGGPESGVVKASMKDGKLMAYPELNSNGYFMYYNKAYFKPEDLNSFERIADVAYSQGKKVSMDLQNGWYLYSFFKAAGLDIQINEDGISNSCNWNARDAQYTGVEVAKSISRLSRHPGFITSADKNFISLIESGEIVAGVNGAWNAIKVSELWGENYAACKLPCINIAGKDLQMHSYAGYKLVGVCSATSYPEWAEKTAEWLTNEISQLAIFENTGECPANMKAAYSPQVKASPAITALAAQSKFSHSQLVYKSVWKPAKLFGVMLTEMTLSDDQLQSELDTLVEAISGK